MVETIASIVRGYRGTVTQNGPCVFFRPDTSILRAVALKSPAGLVSFG